MARLVLATDLLDTTGLANWIRRLNFKLRLLSRDEDLLDSLGSEAASLVILYFASYTLANSLARVIKQEKNIPVLLLLPPEKLNQLSLPLEADDFTVYPGCENEIHFRLKKLLPGNGNSQPEEQVCFGDLVIDLASCQVILNGEILDFTYREYELLKFLASNPGRTFTREVLLNRVWGYDYFGGDRTVDVHIRRIRNKIGDVDRPLIETVRNIGYRFRKQP